MPNPQSQSFSRSYGSTLSACLKVLLYRPEGHKALNPLAVKPEDMKTRPRVPNPQRQSYFPKLRIYFEFADLPTLLYRPQDHKALKP